MLPRYSGLGRTLSSGADTGAARDDIVRAIDHKTRVAAREWERLVDLRQMMPAEQVLTLVGAIAASVRRHVEGLGAPGRQALRAFAADMTALMNARPVARAGK